MPSYEQKTSHSILNVQNLVTSFIVDGQKCHAVDDISFSIAPGQIVGLVGESGSGKSVTSLSLLGLIESPGEITSGKIEFDGRDLVGLKEKELRKIRGNEISMIFQEPMTSLNPVYTIGDQIMEVVRIHKKCSRRDAKNRALEMLDWVCIPDSKNRFNEFPHQLSGGMRQRVMIAMALACSPKLLIADEPTTALDVTIQAQILCLMLELQKELGMSILLITHDLGVVSEVCSDLLVMYAGKIVESGSVKDVFKSPSHPYSDGLLQSIPRLGKKSGHLYSIPGTVPSLGHFPNGCRFQDRCNYVKDRCRDESPKFSRISPSNTSSILAQPQSDSTIDRGVWCWQSNSMLKQKSKSREDTINRSAAVKAEDEAPTHGLSRKPSNFNTNRGKEGEII